MFTLILNEMSEMLSNDNPRFHLHRFEKAVCADLSSIPETAKPDAVDKLEAAMDEYRKAVA